MTAKKIKKKTAKRKPTKPLPLTQAAVVAAARKYDGKKWQHQARANWAMDCVGLIIKVAQDLGIDHDFKKADYGRDPEGQMLAIILRRELVRVWGHPQPGDIILYRLPTEGPRHVAMVTEIGPPIRIIHANNHPAVERIEEIDAPESIQRMHPCGVYRYKELVIE